MVYNAKLFALPESILCYVMSVSLITLKPRQ